VSDDFNFRGERDSAVYHGSGPERRVDKLHVCLGELFYLFWGEKMTEKEISKRLEMSFGWGRVFVPQYTHGNLRIDAILIDTDKRTITGFEIKVSRGDFLADKKWAMYEEFCSSLAIVCPHGLIQSEEIPDPYGLLWIDEHGFLKWKKRARHFQKVCPAWFWTYTTVLEREFKRVVLELWSQKHEIERLSKALWGKNEEKNNARKY
jgi:hypothetical protein